MAATQQSDTETDEVEIKIFLPKNVTVQDKLNLNDKVRTVKEKILRKNHIPYPIKYILVLISLHDERIVLNDNNVINYYADYLRFGHLEVRTKSSEIERPPRPVNPEKFGLTLK
ncbi:hypothetical protein Btru_062860 [Bulinus truncatus]|nr:hypothetical protein Btru_062860 [Bulinus truncatus]